MSLGNVVRVVAVLAACAAAVGSASSSNATDQNGSMMNQYGQQPAGPPPPQQMDPGRALGLWRSTFGAVKIEPDNAKGGITAGAVQGVWVYQRAGQEVVGYFAGTLRGNVLQFRWEEPNNPPLIGEGYLVFDQSGQQYSGRWWSDKRDRVGDWNGWRHGAAGAQPQPAQPGYGQPYGGGYGGYGGQTYGGQPYGGGYPGYGGQGYGPYPNRQYAPYPQPQPQPQPQPYQQPQPQRRYY